MLDHAIESLKEHLRATTEMAKYADDNEDLKRDIYALVSAINILEVYYCGQHKTRYEHYVND